MLCAVVYMEASGPCLGDYGSHTAAINLAYADLHGYDMVLHGGFAGEESHAAWQKLRAVRELFVPSSEAHIWRPTHSYDIVAYVDSDAAVVNMQFNLTQRMAGAWAKHGTPCTLRTPREPRKPRKPTHTTPDATAPIDNLQPRARVTG